MIEFGNSSHVGLRRELNEDTYYSDSELGLWLVADGMGGHEFGEVASALARDSVVREVRGGRSLTEAIRSADEEIIRQSRKRADSLPMGTTMVALKVETISGELRPGFQILLCSDGLTEEVDDATIGSLLGQSELSAQECVDHLVSTALDGGGSDNVTVVLLRRV